MQSGGPAYWGIWGILSDRKMFPRKVSEAVSVGAPSADPAELREKPGFVKAPRA